MARVEFKQGQPVQALSGTYGNAEFRTMKSGKTVVHVRAVETIIEECTAEIQARMGDMCDAISQRQAIKKRVGRFYGLYRHLTEDDEQLKRWIMQAWGNTRRKLPSRGTGNQIALQYKESTEKGR